MAGHSKWAQIKRKKAVTDARRGQLFTRLLKEITVAARLGGGDPAGNPRLRVAIEDARSNNVPNDNIERAIKKGTGELEGVDYEEAVYEGYGPGGIAILLETVTDNKNRTVSEVRHIFSRHGGSLGEAGCVAWMFDKQGYFAIAREALEEERFMELALELGAADISIDEEVYEILTAPESYIEVKDALDEKGVELESHELAMIPTSTTGLPEESVSRVLRLLEDLEEHDDVQKVWSSVDLDAEVLAEQTG